MTEKTGKWYFKKYQRGGDHMAHLMSDDERTFCGKKLKDPIAADHIGPWVPEDHPENTCPRCMSWWRSLKRREVAESRRISAQSSA